MIRWKSWTEQARIITEIGSQRTSFARALRALDRKTANSSFDRIRRKRDGREPVFTTQLDSQPTKETMWKGKRLDAICEGSISGR